MGTVSVSIVPALLFAVLVGGGLLVAMIATLRAALLVLGTMVFLAGISVILDYDKNVYHTWLLPLQRYRSELFGVMGLVLLMGFLPRLGYLSFRPVSGQAWVLLAMGIYAGILRMFHESEAQGAISVVFALVTIVPLMLVLPAMMRNDDDCSKVLTVIVKATLVWTVAVLIQFSINPKLVVLGINNRFTGLIANPNQAATMLAVVATCSLWLGMHGRPSRRPWYIVLTGLFLVLLLWTGSRGGLGMFVLGVSAVMYSRVGRTIMLLPILAVTLFGMLKLADAVGIRLGTERLMTFTDTRSEGWARMLAAGLSSPLIGVGTENAEASENSFLLGFASFGLGMLVLMLLLLAVSARQTLRLLALRRRIDRASIPLVDFCIGQQVVYFAGAIFEGFMHSRVGSHLLFMLVFSQMGAYLLQSQYAPESEFEELEEYPYEELALSDT